MKVKKIKCEGCKKMLSLDEVEARNYSCNIYNVVVEDGKIEYDYVDYEDDLDMRFFCKHCGKELVFGEDEFKELIGIGGKEK